MPEVLDESAKTAARKRAAVWYQKALPELDGLAKKKVEGRLSNIGGIPVFKLSPPSRFNELISEDKHFGDTGNNSKGNIYHLSTSSPVLVATTRIQFQGENRRHDAISNGNIFISLDGSDWAKVAEWNRPSFVESLKHNKWSEFALDRFGSKTVKDIKIKFQYTDGGDAFSIHHVRWIR